MASTSKTQVRKRGFCSIDKSYYPTSRRWVFVFNVLLLGILILLQTHCWVGLDEVEIDLVAEKLTDVAHAVSGRVKR